MKPQLNLNHEEKQRIAEWKASLPQKERKFIYAFVENGSRTEDGYKLYNYIIRTAPHLTGFHFFDSPDEQSLVVAVNVELS